VGSTDADRTERLRDKTRLADARLTDDRGQFAALLGQRALPRLADERYLKLAADKIGVVVAFRRFMNREQPVSRDQLGLPLHRQRFERFRVDCLTDELERRVVDQHLARLRCLLQTRCNVDRVAGRQPLLGAGDDLAGSEADAAFDPEAPEALPHLQRGPAGTQCIVLVRNRDAEHGHDGIADELLNRASVSLDSLLHALEVAGEQRAQGLRVSRLPQRRGADDVAEEDGYDFALQTARKHAGAAPLEQLDSPGVRMMRQIM